MATLQKIRSKGPLLVIVIGLALFAFIAGDAWKALQPHQGRQDIGEVNGESVSAEEYQTLLDEYTEVMKLSQNTSALSDDQMAAIKDEVWHTYVNNKLIATEAEKLGLKVSDAEIQAVISEGSHPLLMNTPFRNPQTGAFDQDMLKKFLVDYANIANMQLPAQYIEEYQRMGAFWNFIERTLRNNLLAEKYQNLLVKSLISNPVAAEDAFAARTLQTDVLLTAIPYSVLTDTTLVATSDDIKALYKERQETYKQSIETRDIKYIDILVTPSDEDRAAVLNEITEYAGQMAEATDMGAFIRTTGTTVPYSEIAANKSVYPSDIAARIDSTVIGEIYGPYYNQADDSYNVMKVIAKENLADSVQFRQIQVFAETSERTVELADSIYKAIQGGADFAELAQQYGQSGEGVWLTGANYEGASLDADNTLYIKSIINGKVNQLTNLKLGQGNVILQVLDKKAMKDKYQIAAIKLPVDFSKETYNKAYNEFSQFVAQNKTIEKLVENAEENGYRLLERNDFRNNEHRVGGVKSTQDALRWVFEAEEGEVSPLYECGENDHLMVVALERINPEGYRNINSVADMLRMEVLQNKKAEKILASMKDVTTMEQAQAMQDAVTDTIKHITFAAPAYISMTYGSEPILSAYASKNEVNKVSGPIKGSSGIYMMQVLNKENNAEEFDAKTEEASLTALAIRYASNFINDLYEKAEIKDNRYIYF